MKLLVTVISVLICLGCTAAPPTSEMKSLPKSHGVAWEDPYTTGTRAIVQHEDGKQEEILVQIIPLSDKGLNIVTVREEDVLILQFYLDGYSIQIYKRALPSVTKE